MSRSLTRRYINLNSMRLLTLIVATLILSGSAAAQQSIRQVGFRNFVYPLSGGTLLGHYGLVWLDTSLARKKIHLVAGSDLEKTSSFVMDGKEYAQYEGFKLESVKFADLTGDGSNEAIVVLRYLTGGTQTTNYVYIYTLENGHPKLLAYCHTGDRAEFGLHGVYGSRGALVFELLDPHKGSGDCCSSGVVVKRFKWHAGRFEPIGVPEHRSIAAPN